MGFRRVDANGSKNTSTRAKDEKVEEKFEDRLPGGFASMIAPHEAEIKGIYRKRRDIASMPVHEQLRHVVMVAIGNDGRVDMQAVKEIRKLLNIGDTRHNAHVHRILDLLENDVKFRELIENVNRPSDSEGTATVKNYIRIMLQLGDAEKITKLHAQQAVLGAVLSDIRQGNTGSCYGTAIAICVHDSIPHLMVEDLSEMVQKGYFVRKRNTNEGEVEERFYIGNNFAINPGRELEQNSFSIEAELSGWKLTDDAISEMSDRLGAVYPEFKEIFEKASELLRSSNTGMRLFIFQGLLQDQFDLTDDDIIDWKALKHIAGEIEDFSIEASLNNDSELDKKVQELIETYSDKSEKLAEKRFAIESCLKAILKMKNILYVEARGISLLTKGWEYAILTSEMRGIQGEHEISHKKIPPMMQEMFKEALFNKDHGELFVNEMNKALEVMQDIFNQMSINQQKAVAVYILKIMEDMKSVIDERITLQTFDLPVLGGGMRTDHALKYLVGDQFKVLRDEKGCAAAVLGCMMEAFEKALETSDEIDEGVRDFLINLKGNLGDKLKSKEFRTSANSILLNSNFERAMRYDESVYDINFETHWRPFPVYFEQEYTRYLLPIEKEDSVFEQFLELIGYAGRMTEVDREEKFIESLYRLIYANDKHLLKKVTGCSITALALAVTGYAPIVLGGVLCTAATIAWKNRFKILPAGFIDIKGNTAILIHFIEAARLIYERVENHENWIKYPIGIPGHACNFMPFNETLAPIVESGDIAEYINLAIANPKKSTIALMDLNYKGNICYVGFELGGGSIRSVYLSPKFEVQSNYPASELMGAQLPKGVDSVVDAKISSYK